MSCAPDKDLCFVLFEHFVIYVTLADGFNSHTIEYYVETKDGEDKQLIAQAQLSLDGKVDDILLGFDTLEGYLNRNFGGGWFHMFSPSMILEVRGGVATQPTEDAPGARSGGQGRLAPGRAGVDVARAPLRPELGDGAVAKASTCPSCGSALHVCANCSFFDTGSRFECKKPIAKRVESKTAANDCSFFKPKTVRDLRAAQPEKAVDARSAFDALFKK